ncbi:hypothetical protein F5890DRAFT_1477291 [Lentinula detonsa]|uniref:Uncharacterized protein n=1 Tax=Lentinula detonsa TaxID=2804962 RepID=A0AA38PST7_9AGAR|nr:hypothetical protein F5890DRAFT_1477291 [Lentinula detonsa]
MHAAITGGRVKFTGSKAEYGACKILFPPTSRKSPQKSVECAKSGDSAPGFGEVVRNTRKIMHQEYQKYRRRWTVVKIAIAFPRNMKKCNDEGTRMRWRVIPSTESPVTTEHHELPLNLVTELFQAVRSQTRAGSVRQINRGTIASWLRVPTHMRKDMLIGKLEPARATMESFVFTNVLIIAVEARALIRAIRRDRRAWVQKM